MEVTMAIVHCRAKDMPIGCPCLIASRHVGRFRTVGWEGRSRQQIVVRADCFVQQLCDRLAGAVAQRCQLDHVFAGELAARPLIAHGELDAVVFHVQRIPENARPALSKS